jgi:hypothetical protein
MNAEETLMPLRSTASLRMAGIGYASPKYLPGGMMAGF